MLRDARRVTSLIRIGPRLNLTARKLRQRIHTLLRLPRTPDPPSHPNTSPVTLINLPDSESIKPIKEIKARSYSDPRNAPTKTVPCGRNHPWPLTSRVSSKRTKQPDLKV